MKLALLISVLIASLCSVHGIFDPVSIPVRVKGTLSCSTPFQYQIRLEEQDNVVPDDIQIIEWTLPNNTTANYEVSGTGAEWNFVEDEIEPLMVIHHSC
ncbi:hypothetical protein PENTCL1PPCAC_3095, partial [Pristionchus entomophagus]